VTWATGKLLIDGVTGFLLIAFAGSQLFAHGPRKRLTWRDTDPRGWFALLVISCFALLWAGGLVLFTPGQTFRLGGALSLGAGVALLWTIVRYLRRPTDPVTIDSLRDARPGVMFSRTTWGYDRLEVDQFFESMSHATPDAIRSARFHTRRWGYRQAAVDAALDDLLTRKS